jgi:LuxR family maltose regulon positive regulatory protein
MLAAHLDAQAATGSRPRGTAPVQPLTDAELRVLAKLAEHLSYSEAAAELFVSLNTVKTHVSHAYTKLGVTSRREAIARVAALGLI